jgi:hypothetical protein
VARLKGDARLATVIERAVWQQLRQPTEALVVPRGARRWRVPAYEAEGLIAELRSRGGRYGAGRTMLAQRLAHQVLVKMETAGDSPDDRVQDAVARSRPVRAYVDSVWPRADPARVVHGLLSDAGTLLTNIVSLVRFTLDGDGELVPFPDHVHERFEGWLAQQATAGRQFTSDQLDWLRLICDHLAASLSIEPRELTEPPFSGRGGLGRARELFGADLDAILAQLTDLVAA